MLMIATGLTALVLFFRKRLFDARWFHYWCMALTPAGFIAVLAGWFVTEIGRQPYIVYGILRTAEAASPVPGPRSPYPWYLCDRLRFVFGAGSYYILKLMAKGPGARADLRDHGSASRRSLRK